MTFTFTKRHPQYTTVLHLVKEDGQWVVENIASDPLYIGSFINCLIFIIFDMYIQ